MSSESKCGDWVTTRQDVSPLQERVAQLFEEARDDVYRYLISLGLYPPQAQEVTQEVFLRLYQTLCKGDSERPGLDLQGGS